MKISPRGLFFAISRVPHSFLEGKEFAQEIGAILNQYYVLNFQRKPEFMGFNRSYPQGPIKDPQFGLSECVQRIEAFNAFNWFRWGNPVTNFSSATFGRILSADDPRIMQFAVKYSF